MTGARLTAFGVLPKFLGQKAIGGGIRTLLAMLVFAAGSGGAWAKCFCSVFFIAPRWPAS